MKKVLALVLSLMLVLSMLPGVMMVQADEYETVSVLTGGNDFSTVLAVSGTQLAGGGYTMQNVSSSFTSMAVKEKAEVSQLIASGVTSQKVLVLTPTGSANPTVRFKGFTQTAGGEPIRIKYKMYLENTSETGTYHIQALPQVGTGSSSASGGLETSDVPANQWIEINEVVTPKSGVDVGGIKFTITKTTATSYPTTIYMDGNIVVEKVKVATPKTPDELLSEAKELLDIGNTSAVEENLVLPTAGANGSTITWETTDATVVETNGTIHRGTETKTATLTATLSLDGATSVTKDFTVTVAAESQEEEPAGPQYETVSALTGGNDFSTVFSGTGSQLAGGSYTMQNVSSSFTSMAVEEKSAVSQSVADGVTSAKVLTLAPAGSADPTIRFKGFSATTVGDPIRIKFKIYLAHASETGTYNIKVQPQKGTTASSASGAFDVSGVTANQWVEVNQITTPTSSAQGIKITINKATATNYPTTIYLDGNIVIEQLKEVIVKTPDELLAEDVETLTLGDTSAVEENLVLPTAGANGSTITWATSDATVVEPNGTIHRAAEDKTITLTATLSLDGATPVTKDFQVTVKLQSQQGAIDQEKVNKDKDDLDLGDTSAVTEDLTLPTAGANGSTITWKTSDATVIESNGTIHRGADDKRATLTATIASGEKSAEKTFTVTVKADTERFQVEWNTIFSQNFTSWTRYDQTTATSINYPARYGASTQNRMEFRYNGGGTEPTGGYPALKYEISAVSKDSMTTAHPGTTNGATGSGNYAKIYRESNVGALFFKLNAPTSVAVGDKVKTTFRIFPTDICLTGKTTEGNELNYDEEGKVATISYTVHNNVATSATATKTGGYSKEITLIPNQWNIVTLEYTATMAGVGGFQFNLGGANYSPETYNTPFPATIYIDGDVKIEQGVVTEVIVLTPAEKAALDKDALTLGDISAVVNNLVLPVIGSVHGSTITWATSDPDVVEADGTIHRGTEAKTATLTATITNGSASVTKEFTVTVAGEETAAAKVELDKAALDLGDISAVTQNLTLPTVGSVRNSQITWTTSDASVVESNGTIHRAEENKTATLTATISLDGASVTKEFVVTVKGNIERKNLQGVNGTYFYGGEFVEKSRIYFGTLFEGDGSNGTNGTMTFTPAVAATADKEKYIGLVAEKTADNGIRFKGWVPDSYTGVSKDLLSKTYTLPEMEYPGQPYYVELEVDSQTRGEVTYNFGNGNGDVLSILKTDSRQQVGGVWKDVLDQEDYVFYIGGVEKARTDVVRKKVTTFGIYVIPELKQIAIYQDGTLLTSQVFNYTGEDTVLNDVTVSWKQSKGSSGIPESSYLHLRSMALFEGPALSEADSLTLDKEKFRFSIVTDEAFDSITKDLTLPATAIFGSEVRWSSSDNTLLDPATGKIYRDEKLDKKVTLYAEIGPEGNSVTKEQEFTILASTPRAELKGIPGTYFYDNTFYQVGRIEFGDIFEGGSVNADGWAANGTNGTVYVTPITTEGATLGERTPGLYAKKTEENGIWYQSLVASAENNGQGLPIFEKTYTLPEITDNGRPYYIELSAEMYIRDSLTLSFGNKDNGVVEIEKLDQNEHADRADKDPFVVRTSNMERFEFPYTYSSNPQQAAVKLGIQVIPQLKQVLVYKDGELMYSEPLDFSKKSTVLKTLTIKWEHSTVRTTLMQGNFLHLKQLSVYEGGSLPPADRLTLDGEAILISSFTNEKKDQITKDLTLPSKGVYGCDITWTSSDESVINPETGEVTRQNEAKTVTLTATISVDGESISKDFELLVVRKGTEGGVMTGSSVTLETPVVGELSSMTDGIFETYIETLKAGVKPKITIDMGEAKLISDVIIYERMIDGQYNIKKAKLEVSADGKTWNKVAEIGGIGASSTVEFSPQEVRYICLTVTGLDSDKTVSLYEIEAVMSADDNSIVDADMSVLKAFDSYNVSESVVLPTRGKLGSIITWTTSNSAVVDSTGKVTRPEGAGANVTLTATVTYGSVSKTISFSHYVEGLTSGGAGGSGGGAGGSGGGAGGSGGGAGSSGGGAGSYEGGGSGATGNDKVTGTGAMNEVVSQPEAPDHVFSDVEETSWAYPYIEKLYTEKIMEGDGNGNFDPKRPIRREEFLKILLLALNVEIDETVNSVFSDVKESDWYAPFVNTAYKLGLSNGMGDGSFGVGQTISRQDMAVLANRVASLQGVELTSAEEKVLADIKSVNDYAKESVQLLANAGIISGDEYSVFNPQGKALREQAAKIICMLMELKEQEDALPVE